MKSGAGNSRFTISAVPSVEPSSTTSTSTCPFCSKAETSACRSSSLRFFTNRRSTEDQVIFASHLFPYIEIFSIYVQSPT